MINLIIFILSFSIWLYLIVKNKQPNWSIFIFSFIWGAFLVQTILWICGIPTVIEMLIR